MRHAVLLATTAVVLAGCAHTVTGSAAVRPVIGVLPADADRILLRAADVGNIVGAKLQIDADRSRPIAGASAAPACSALDAVGMAAFVGDSWSRFHLLLFTDGDRREQVVSQAVAVYPDPATAATAFTAATAAARACDGQRAAGVGGDAAWGFTVGVIDADAVRWRKNQIGIPLTWVCRGEARLRTNAVLQAMACGGENSSRDSVTRLADRMSASVWEHSDR